MIHTDEASEERLLHEVRALLAAFAELRTQLELLGTVVQELHASIERGCDPARDESSRRAAERRAADLSRTVR